MRASNFAPWHGVALITCGALFGAISDAITKLLTARLSVAQIVFWHSVIVAFAVVLLCASRRSWRPLHTARWGLHLTRGIAHVATSLLFVAGLALLPFSTAVTLWFANPLFTSALSPLLLGERGSRVRWVLVLVGFGGVALIAGPTGAGISLAIAYPLGAALGGAMRDVLTRVMSTRGESTESMILYSAIVMIVASGLLSGGSADLSAVDGVQVALLATSGLVYLAALYCIAESLKRAKASSVAPFRYTTIVWASALDFLIWHNPPAPNVIGGTLIVFAAMYALLRLEARELAR